MRMGCTNEYRRGSTRRRVAVTRRDEKNARATKSLNLRPTTSPPLALSAAVHRLRPPHALHELVPPAQPSVEPVPRGVQFVVVLVVHLRGPKRSRVDDRGLERRDVGVKLKGVRSGVERRRGRGLKARDPGRRDAAGKVLKDRRSPRERGRMGTSVWDAPDPSGARALRAARGRSRRAPAPWRSRATRRTGPGRRPRTCP